MRTRLRSVAKALARHVGVYWPVLREKRAFTQLRLSEAVKIRGRPGRLALIGCGAMGTTVAGSLRHLPGWQVGALYDTREEAVQRLGQEWPQAIRAATLEEFMDHARLADVLAIATTADAHAALALRALKAEVMAIFLEKPVTACLADADELVEVAGRAGIRVAVDHTRRWLPSVEGVRRLLASDVIGRLRAIHFVYGWAGFGMIGTHLFDFVRYLTGSDVTRVRAELDAGGQSKRGAQFRDPSGLCEARCRNGVRVTMDLSKDLELRQMLYVLVCQRGRLEVDERLGRIRLVGTGGHVWEAEYVFPEALPLGVARALFELQSRREPRCTLDDGRAALEAAIACRVSARSGGAWIDLPLEGSVRQEVFPFA